MHKHKQQNKISAIFRLLSVTLFVSLGCANLAKAAPLTDIYEITPELKCSLARTDETLAMQGVRFIDDHTVVYAGYQSDKTATVLTLVDLDQCTVLDRNNDIIMGHANDIAYNENNNMFYVTTGLNDKKIHSFQISANRITIVGIEQSNIRLAAFEHDYDKNRYIGYGNGNWYILPELTSDNNATETITGTIQSNYDNYINHSNEQITFVPQNISYANGNVYFAKTISDSDSDYYNDSYVMVYDADSWTYKYSMHFPSSHFWGHLEGVTVIGDKIFFGINVHNSNGGNSSSFTPNQSFLVYSGINAIEEKYKTDHTTDPEDSSEEENAPEDNSKEENDPEDNSKEENNQNTSNNKDNRGQPKPKKEENTEPDVYAPDTGQAKTTDRATTMVCLGIIPLATIFIILALRKRKGAHRIYET